MSKLKQLREERGLPQKAVAKSVGITTSYYGMIELETRRPSLKLIKRLNVFFISHISTNIYRIRLKNLIETDTLIIIISNKCHGKKNQMYKVYGTVTNRI